MSLPKIVCLTFFLFGIVTLAVNAELVAYWSFDKADGVDDLTGNGHDGNIHGNPKVVAGKFGNLQRLGDQSKHYAKNNGNEL